MTTAFAPAHGWGSGPRRDAPVDARRLGAKVIEIQAREAQSVLPWLGHAVQRLNSVGRLEHGWDGEDARPPTAEAAVAALRALFEVMWPDTPAPSVVPMYDGGVQLEWHGQGLDIELTVAPDGDRHVWMSATSGLEIDNDFRYVVEDLRKHLGTLTRG